MNESRSGQAMIEACLGIALLTFVFVLVGVSTFMSNNRIRTAMAARHAAWMHGADLYDNSAQNREYLNNVNIDNWFFFPSKDAHLSIPQQGRLNIDPTRHTQVAQLPGTSSGLRLQNLPLHTISVDAQAKIADILQEAKTLPAYQVSYGLQSPDHFAGFPYNLLRTDVPFMPTPLVTSLLNFDSVCQWEPVSNPWAQEKDNAAMNTETFLGDLWLRLELYRTAVLF